MNKVKKSQKKKKKPTIGRMKGRRKYVPSSKDLRLAYKLHLKGETQKTIAQQIGISIDRWTANKPLFFAYFEKRDILKDKKAAYDEGNKHVKGPRRKFSMSMRNQLLRCLENDLGIVQACKVVGIAYNTVNAWSKEYPGFKREMDCAKEVGVLQVKKAMKKSAMGGLIRETLVVKEYDMKGKLVNKKVTEKDRYIPAAVEAQKFILKNRAGWSEEPKSNADDKGKIMERVRELTDISDEECKKFEK